VFNHSLISISLGHRKEYRICIELVAAIVLLLHKILLRSLPDLWLSLVLKFIHYMNSAIPLETNLATSLRGTRTRARTTEWDMTAEDAFRCLFDEHKRSVDKSGCLDDAKQIVSELNSSQDDVAGSRKPLQSHLYICLACPPYLQSLEPLTHPPHLSYCIASPLTLYSTLPTYV